MTIEENGKWRKVNALELVNDFILYSVNEMNKKSVTTLEIMNFIDYASKYIDLEMPVYENDIDLLSMFFSAQYKSGRWTKDGVFVSHLTLNYNLDDGVFEVTPTEEFNLFDSFCERHGRLWLLEAMHIRITLLNYFESKDLNPAYKFTNGSGLGVKY